MGESGAEGDLGFTYHARQSGEVVILHRGRIAATLRGTAAADFLREVAERSAADAQQRMARLTGNYKRGNERTGKNHPRNRG